MKRLFPLIFVCLILQIGQAQDFRFAQYFNSPQTLNPSLIGLFEGTNRVTAIYRTQWSSLLEDNPFETIAVGYDHKFNVYGDDIFATGLSVVRDQVGDSQGRFRHTNVMLSAAYIKLLSANRYSNTAHYLAIGIQGGFGNNQFFTEDAWYSSQFDLITYQVNQSLPSQERFDLSSRSYFDSHVGLTYYGQLGENSTLIIGGAYHHINKPIIFFSGNRDYIAQKITGHISFDYAINNELSIRPSGVFQSQGPSTNFALGSSLKYENGDWNEIALRVGLWAYMANSVNSFIQDAATVFVQFEVERLAIGMSYDVNMSELKRYTDRRGAFEVSASYRFSTPMRTRIKNPEFF